jgi:hypothetical protein
LVSASIEDACLAKADMEFALMANAMLRGAYLREADMSGAQLDAVVLTGADLRKVNGLGRNDIQTLPESRKAAEDLLLGAQRDGAGRGMPHFETAPFDRSGTSPRAIREGREVSRWRPRASTPSRPEKCDPSRRPRLRPDAGPRLLPDVDCLGTESEVLSEAQRAGWSATYGGS